jgi:hypothetical protein
MASIIDFSQLRDPNIGGRFMEGYDAQRARQLSDLNTRKMLEEQAYIQAQREKAAADAAAQAEFLRSAPQRFMRRSYDVGNMGAEGTPVAQSFDTGGFGREAMAVPGLFQTGLGAVTKEQEREDKQAEFARLAQEKFKEQKAVREAEITARLAQAAEQREFLAQQGAAQRQNALLIAGMRDKNEPMNLTEVNDPADPSKMLRVDARKYQGGSIGSPGVIGYSGKEPTAAKREEKAMEGRSGLSETLTNLRQKYQKLNELGGIASTARGGASNIASATQASGLGQATGRVFGTEAQKLRDEIKSARVMLLQDIKNATGMSAQQMNSNVELQTWLNAATDPSLIYESNLGILDAIEEKFLNAGKQAPAKPAGSQAKQAPRIGTVEGGYVFTGGNPADPNAWKPAK